LQLVFRPTENTILSFDDGGELANQCIAVMVRSSIDTQQKMETYHCYTSMTMDGWKRFKWKPYLLLKMEVFFT
jgi:hypothetical protein